MPGILMLLEQRSPVLYMKAYHRLHYLWSLKLVETEQTPQLKDCRAPPPDREGAETGRILIQAIDNRPYPRRAGVIESPKPAELQLMKLS